MSDVRCQKMDCKERGKKSHGGGQWAVSSGQWAVGSEQEAGSRKQEAGSRRLVSATCRLPPAFCCLLIADCCLLSPNYCLILKIRDRVTMDRALSGSVASRNASVISLRSFSERRARSAANAGPILSAAAILGVAIQTK